MHVFEQTLTWNVYFVSVDFEILCRKLNFMELLINLLFEKLKKREKGEGKKEDKYSVELNLLH